jgi:hypothetical protein
VNTSAPEIRIEPQARWPRQMTPGRPYLIELDLRLASSDWPYADEEFAFTFLVDGGPGITVDSLGNSTVVLHRFGGTYGPARFVAVADEWQGDHFLWLSLLTQRGIVARTDKLPVTIRGVDDDIQEEAGTALPGFAREALARAGRNDPGRQFYFMVQLEPGGFRPDHYLTTVWSQLPGDYPVTLLPGAPNGGYTEHYRGGALFAAEAHDGR